MDYFSLENMIGYAASFFVVASFLIHNNIKTTRLINLIGAILFVVYGYCINSLPIIIPNVFLVGIQLYYLLIKQNV